MNQEWSCQGLQPGTYLPLKQNSNGKQKPCHQRLYTCTRMCMILNFRTFLTLLKENTTEVKTSGVLPPGFPLLVFLLLPGLRLLVSPVVPAACGSLRPTAKHCFVVGLFLDGHQSLMERNHQGIKAGAVHLCTPPSIYSRPLSSVCIPRGQETLLCTGL